MLSIRRLFPTARNLENEHELQEFVAWYTPDRLKCLPLRPPQHMSEYLQRIFVTSVIESPMVGTDTVIFSSVGEVDVTNDREGAVSTGAGALMDTSSPLEQRTREGMILTVVMLEVG